jgi:pheromone a factor receptor
VVRVFPRFDPSGSPNYLPGLALREFNRRRIQFSQLMNSNTSLTMSRYFRLMALAMTEMLCTTPLAIFVIYLNATSSVIGPWRSWADTHFVFSRIEQIPSVLWRSNHLLVVSMELTRWVAPFCAIVFFGFFGFAQEAKKNYRVVYDGIAKRLGVVPLLSSPLSCKGAPRYAFYVDRFAMFINVSL